MKVLDNIEYSDMLFVYIETARSEKELVEGSDTFEAWKYKRNKNIENSNLSLEEDYKINSDIYAEFSKVVCISIGVIDVDGLFIVKNYKDDNEVKLLEMFNKDMERRFKRRPNTLLCGHSVKNFNIPFLFRRSVVNRVKPCSFIDIGDSKPWDVRAIDAKEIWKGTGYYYSSIMDLCFALGVKNKTINIKRGDISDMFHQGGIEMVINCSQESLFSVMNCIRIMKMDDPLKSFKVREVSEEPETVLGRIIDSGVVLKKDAEELIAKASQLAYDEKEMMITSINAALAISKSEIDKELKLKIYEA